jgi:hypothetical protein
LDNFGTRKPSNLGHLGRQNIRKRIGFLNSLGNKTCF